MEETAVKVPEVPERKASDTIKSIITSKLFLFVVICSVVSVIFAIVQAVQSKSILTELLVALKDMELPVEDLGFLEEIAEKVDKALLIFTIIGLIPAIALAAGYCLFYLGSLKKDDKLVSYGSYCVLAFSIANMILPALYILLVAIAALLLIAVFEAPAATVALIALIVCVPFVLTLTYYSKLCKMATGINLTLKHGKNLLKVDSFVVVCSWIYAIYNIITSFNYISSDFVAFLNCLVSPVCIIIVMLLFSKYKNTEGTPSSQELIAYAKKK